MPNDEATFFRAGLLLGLVRGETVTAWADALINAAAAPDATLIDLAMTPSDDLTAMRLALLPLADATESPVIVGRLLCLVADDYASGRRNMTDTVRVLGQMRRMIAIPEWLKEPLNMLEYGHVLAVHTGGDVAAAEQRVEEWLAPFSRSHSM